MTEPRREPAQLLAELLETLPPEDRKALTAWLLPRMGGAGMSAWAVAARSASRLTGTLAAGEDSQLVTIRLPAERHAELRDWCATHEFTMAAVLRGLVDRFLEQQRR